jgi:hypothetical protein
MNSETKTKLRQILEKLDEDPNKWTPEEQAWFSSLPDLLPKKLRRLGDLLQDPLSICVVLPYYSIAVALFTLFLLIPSLIANVLVDAWKKVNWHRRQLPGPNKLQDSGMAQSTRIPYPRFFSYVGYTIFSLILAAVILEFGATILRWAYHRAYPRDAQSMAGSPPYQGYAWALEFWKEEYLRRASSTAHHYVPFLIWGERPWHSSTINVDESAIGNLRRTVNPTDPACPQTQRKVIWMLGGSTLFGMGVPDMETIPSHLSRELNAAGSGCFVVLNLGMEGYLTNQELILLVEALKTGQRPDMVVFYDGVNEAYAAAAPGVPGRPTPHLEFQSIKARVEGSLASALDFCATLIPFNWQGRSRLVSTAVIPLSLPPPRESRGPQPRWTITKPTCGCCAVLRKLTISKCFFSGNPHLLPATSRSHRSKNNSETTCVFRLRPTPSRS